MADQYEEIKIDVSPEGEVVIGVTGVTGPSCHDLTREIEDALGSTTDRQNTAEYDQTVQQRQTERHHERS